MVNRIIDKLCTHFCCAASVIDYDIGSHKFSQFSGLCAKLTITKSHQEITVHELCIYVYFIMTIKEHLLQLKYKLLININV